MSHQTINYSGIEADLIQTWKNDEEGNEREIFIRYGTEKDERGEPFAYLDSVTWDSPKGERIHPSKWSREERNEWCDACEDHARNEADSQL